MKNLLFLMIFAAAASLQAQVAINIHGEDPDPSAMLDVKATDKGLLIPRLTTQQMQGINNAAEGLLVYNKDEKAFYYFDGTEWILASADNLGNHKATENLQMQGHWITNDGDDEGIYVTEAGHVGLGTDQVFTNTNGEEAGVHVVMDANTANLYIERNEDAARPAGFVFLKSRGTFDNKQAVQDGDILSSFSFRGWDGSTYKAGAKVNIVLDDPNAEGNIPATIQFFTRDRNNKGFGSPRMVILYNGNVGIGTETPQRKLHIKDVMRLEPRDSAPDNPQAGDIYYDSTDNTIHYYNGREWRKLRSRSVNN